MAWEVLTIMYGTILTRIQNYIIVILHITILYKEFADVITILSGKNDYKIVKFFIVRKCCENI